MGKLTGGEIVGLWLIMNRFNFFVGMISCWSLSVASWAADRKPEVVVQGGSGSETGMMDPFSVVFDAAGTMYGVEFTKTNRVFRLSKDGKFSFIAGQKAGTDMKQPLAEVGDGKSALEARFNGMHDLCLLYSSKAARDAKGPQDWLLLADTFNHRIRKLDLKMNVVTTVAGTGLAGYNGGAQSATETALSQPICLSAAEEGAFWITDLGNQRVRKLLLKEGKVIDVAGNGKKGKLTDGGKYLESPLHGVRAVAANEERLWIALREGNSLVLGEQGTLRTVVNQSGKAGYSGDGGGDPLEGQLKGPKYLSLDAKGNVLICDTENHVIRRYVPGRVGQPGKLELLVGTPGKATPALGATALETSLNRPHGTCLHDGWLYVADTENHRVIRVPYAE
jgi:hypothetical protein